MKIPQPTASASASASAGSQLLSADRLLFPALGSFYARAEPALYAVLRLVFGIIMFTHGFPKVLGSSHGSMADPMASSINLIQNVMGLPFASQLAFLVMLLETVGGLMLAIGFRARPVALAISVEMIGISYALGPTWPWIDRGIEFPVLMLFLALYIAVRGSGRFAMTTDIVIGMVAMMIAGISWRAPRRSDDPPAKAPHSSHIGE